MWASRIRKNPPGEVSSTWSRSVHQGTAYGEISENLHRAELTALERDKLVAEWVELTGEVSPQSGAEVGKWARAGRIGGRFNACARASFSSG